MVQESIELAIDIAEDLLYSLADELSQNCLKDEDDHEARTSIREYCNRIIALTYR